MAARTGQLQPAARRLDRTRRGHRPRRPGPHGSPRSAAARRERRLTALRRRRDQRRPEPRRSRDARSEQPGEPRHRADGSRRRARAAHSGARRIDDDGRVPIADAAGVIEPGTVADALVAAASSDRGVRAIEHDGRASVLAYKTLLAESLQIAGALQARGLTTGDRVALVIPEVADFIRVFFGISVAGLVPVPLCPPAQAGDLPTFARQSHDILDASRASAVVTTADVEPLLPTKTVLVDDLRAGPSLARPIAVPIEAPALLQFTSGSTAAPKGVVLT